MRILLTGDASYLPPKGDSTRVHLVWLRELIAAGHECRVVCASLSPQDDRIEHGRIVYIRVHDLERRAESLTREIAEFTPDWLLVSSEDTNQSLLRAAHSVAPDRLVYLAHTAQFFPFGPQSWSPSAPATRIVRQAAAIIVNGDHLAAYVRRHTGRDAVILRPNVYGQPPFPRFGRFDTGSVLMINPCAVKGISIFTGLAGRFPQFPFAAMKGWCTTADDLHLLSQYPNITVLDEVRDIDEMLASASVLLIPSLWYEGFALIAMQAMLRGLPVISSDSAGLAEAKRGTGFVIPVEAIDRYEPVFDEAHLLRPVLPDQNLEPWMESLQALVTDRELYSQESERSRQAGLRFVESLSAGGLTSLLQSLTTGPARPGRATLRILLAHNSLYYPAFDCAGKSNRLLMEALAVRGHEVRVFARLESFSERAHQRLLDELERRNVTLEAVEQGAVHFRLNGVDVRTATADPQFSGSFSSQVRDYDPDVIITSIEDPEQLLVDVAVNAPRARVVHLVRAAIDLTKRTELLLRADAIVGVSEYVVRYLREHGHRDAVHVPISPMEPGGFADVGGFDNEFVTIVDPCAIKGIDIFLAVAYRMSEVRFAAVPTGGTSEADLKRLRALPNVEIVPPSDRVVDLLRRTRVLLVPSLSAEGQSRIVVEAMAYGVPVVASDVGGIPEAKLGVPYLLPVRPEQDLERWLDALEGLVTDREHYAAIAGWSRSAALEYVRNLSVEPFEQLLENVVRLP